ncbi:hypothetical protein FKW77_007003 [Venturia effusa]|uniref:BTB domain-containing protein n=1 Tax=Venturia effusa TaxID=50376 RepID=A0A517L1K1_9PEZI|nr:hypothetical protein FKW77_007003 [Venturia effusa]
MASDDGKDRLRNIPAKRSWAADQPATITAHMMVSDHCTNRKAKRPRHADRLTTTTAHIMALHHGKDALAKTVSSLYGDTRYSDLKIEGQVGIIELVDENPSAVRAMLQFIYMANYHNLKVLPGDASMLGPIPMDKDLSLDANVYILADKYMMPSLKELAFSRFEVAALIFPIMWPGSFFQVVQEVYENTAEGNRLREILSLAMVENPARTLKGFLEKEGEEFTQLMLDLPEFAIDIIKYSSK